MRNPITFLALLSVSLVLTVAGVRGAETIHLLNAAGQTFTNVVVEQVSDTHLFFKYQGGMSSVKLMDLSPELQQRFGYNPAKGAQLLNEQAAADANFESRYATPVQGGNSLSNAPTGGTNDLKYPTGRIDRDFRVGKTGILSLSFPNKWMYDAEESTDPSFPGLNLRFGPQYGSNFLVLVSTVPAEDGATRAGPEKMMTMVASHLARRAVENPISLTPLTGAEVNGYYFAFTDKTYVNKEPKPGAYRYQTQGMVTLDNFSLSFSVLFNYREDGHEKAMLDMIRTVHFHKVQ